MDRFNTNKDVSRLDAEYIFEISLTVQEIKDLVDYTKNKKANIKYVIEHILDEINVEVYGIER